MLRAVKSSRRACLIAATSAVFNASGHAATTATWLDPLGGVWTDGTNWSTHPYYPNNGSPAGITYHVLIDQGAVTLASSSPNIVVDSVRLGPDGRYQAVAPDAHNRLRSTSLSGFWLDPAWLEQDPAPNVERLMLRIAPDAYRAYLAQLLADETGET